MFSMSASDEHIVSLHLGSAATIVWTDELRELPYFEWMSTALGCSQVHYYSFNN